jgi:hypothetical protein
MIVVKVKPVRILNGYRVIYNPEYHRAMSSNNWSGYVYEHIVVAEEMIGRNLREEEVVHHLDGDRSNNRIENLLVLSNAMHAKLHGWLENGGVFKETEYVKRVNSEKSKEVRTINRFCKVCKKTLQAKEKLYCSNKCRGIGTRKVERPSSEELAKDIESMSWLAIGRKYGVSDNAVRKWARSFELL